MEPDRQALKVLLKGFFARETRVLQVGAGFVHIGDWTHQNAEHARLLRNLCCYRRKVFLMQQLDHDLGFVVVDGRKLQIRPPGFRLAGSLGAAASLDAVASLGVSDGAAVARGVSLAEGIASGVGLVSVR
jgi:hypothetical protein